MFIINCFNFVLLYFCTLYVATAFAHCNVSMFHVKHCVIYTNFHNSFCIGIVLLCNALYSSNTLQDNWIKSICYLLYLLSGFTHNNGALCLFPQKLTTLKV